MSVQPNTLTYEQLMALFLENREQMKEIALQMKKSNKQLRKRVLELGSRIGDIIEHMVKGNIIDQFRDFGYDVTGCSPNKTFKNKKLGPAVVLSLDRHCVQRYNPLRRKRDRFLPPSDTDRTWRKSKISKEPEKGWHEAKIEL